MSKLFETVSVLEEKMELRSMILRRVAWANRCLGGINTVNTLYNDKKCSLVIPQKGENQSNEAMSLVTCNACNIVIVSGFRCFSTTSASLERGHLSSTRREKSSLCPAESRVFLLRATRMKQVKNLKSR